MKRLAVLFVFATFIASCGDRAPGAAVDSGIRGVVLSGPQCPVETAESPCPDLPVAGIVVRVMALDGSLAAKSVTNSEGDFRVAVGPGDYVVQPVVEGGGVTSSKQQQVTVADGEFIEVTLLVDTGIR